MIATETTPATTGNTLDDELVHYFCECDENLALCGADLTGNEEIIGSDDDLTCVVCDELAEQPCPRCGE